MYQLYHKYKDLVCPLYKKYKNHDSIFLFPLVIIALFKILQYFFWLLYSGQGFPQSDDSKWYINYANALVKNLTDGLDMNDVLYFGYNILLSALLAIFKDPTAVIFIQAVTASLSVILVYRITKILFNRASAIIASLFYLSSWDITLWSMYILSDSFFISLLLLSVYFLLMALESKEKKYKILFSVTSLYLLVFRPTGIISLLFILIYLITIFKKNEVLDFIKAHWLLISSLLLSVFIIFLYLYIDNKLDPLFNSLQFNAKKVLYNIYAKGWIYDKPTPHDYFFKSDYKINVCNSLVLSYIINNWDHVLIVYGKRAIAFLGHWVWKTDLTSFSGIMKFAVDILPSALFAIGTLAAIRNKLFKKASIVWFIIFSIFAFCTLVFIDWMYRYRAPAIPFIAMVAAYGAERIIHRSFIIVKKYTGIQLWEKEKY